MTLPRNQFYRNTLAVIAGLLLVDAVLAQPAFNDNAFADHFLLAGFPDSEIVNIEYAEDVNYRFVLGSLQRTRGHVEPENSERLRGSVTKITYEISQEFTGADVHAFYLEQISEKGYAQLFSCEGRACGSSNFWANDIFKNRILYGPERNQYYLALRTGAGLETDSRIALYIITRGNRRLYAYVEIVEVPGEQSTANTSGVASLTQTLRDQGRIILSGVEFDINDRLVQQGNLDLIVDLLNQDASMQIYLVAHLREGGPIESLMSRSLVRASSLRQELINRGIDGSRISAQGVGPLAPACAATNCESRVEAVLQ